MYFQGICKQLLCPIGHIPVYGKCKGLFSNIDGYTIAVHFEVTIQYGNITDSTILLHVLQKRIVRELGDIQCGICKSSLFWGKNSTSQIFLRHEAFAKDGCPYDALLERIRKIAINGKMHLQFKYKDQNVRIVLPIIFEDIDHTTGFKALDERTAFFCRSAYTIDETILSYCPAILLSHDEASQYGLNKLQDTDMNTTVKVCLESYFSARQQNIAAATLDNFTFYIIYTLCLIAFAYL
jgi:hypothetical protein